MEKLAQAISHVVGRNLELDAEKQKVIAYGLAALFQMVIILIVITVAGVLGGFCLEALVLFFGVGLLRKSSGGNHAPTFNSCLFISIGSICLMAAFAHYVPNQANALAFVLFTMISYSLTFWLVYRLAPVDTPNKPIVNPHKRKKLRKDAVITVAIYLLLTVTFISFRLKRPALYHMGISLAIASLWQAFTLTKWSKGFFTIHKVKKEDKG